MMCMVVLGIYYNTYIYIFTSPPNYNIIICDDMLYVCVGCVAYTTLYNIHTARVGVCAICMCPMYINRWCVFHVLNLINNTECYS